MKAKCGMRLAVVALLILLVGYLALNGAHIGDYEILPIRRGIRLGLDLRGGIYTEYIATDTTVEGFDSLMDSTVSTLRTRLDAAGYPEATVARQGSDRIRVEIPDVEDPEAILEIVGTPAHLEFRDPNGKVVLEGRDIKNAGPLQNQTTQQWSMGFELNDEGREKFAEATTEWVGQAISIYLDDELISAPTVEEPITGGSGSISFENENSYTLTQQETYEKAYALALQIMSGALPLDLEESETRAISATLGVEAIDGALLAGMIGLILIILFMVAVYRLPGVAASMALLIYILIVFVLVCEIPGVQLTLQGVAGILLGIGMAVDANVVIFERFREELKGGRSLENAVKFGYKNALGAIMDSNVTTIIAAVVLLLLGTGTIQGFATTLLISVITSLFTAVFVTRFLLRQIVGLGFENVALYSRPARAPRNSDKRRFTGKTKWFLAGSAVTIVAAIVLQLAGAGMNLGIDFTGGSLLSYSVGENFDVNDVETILKSAGYTEFQVAKAAPSAASVAWMEQETADAQAAALEHDHDGDGVPDHEADSEEARSEAAAEPVTAQAAAGLLNPDKSGIPVDGMTDLQIRLSLVDETEGLEEAVTGAVNAAMPGTGKISSGVMSASEVTQLGYDADFVGGYAYDFAQVDGYDPAAVETAVTEALQGTDLSVEKIAVVELTAQAAEAQDTQASAQEEAPAVPTVRVLVSVNDQTTRVRALLEREMRAKYEDFRFVSIDHVSAVAGRDLLSNALKALLIAFVCLLLYIAIRFDFFSGLAALFALVHDVLFMAAFMVFFQSVFQVNSSFIAAILTIVGYSINNTIIIFDRIRETARKPGYTQLPRRDIVESSVGATLSRTINTSLTTLITLLCLFIFGVDSIREFAFPLIIGMVAGTYSSVMLSGQVWAMWMERFGKRRKQAK